MSHKPIISPVFDQPGAKFVLMPIGKKFPPIETEWQNKGHTFQEAAEHKGNVGIMACNDFIGLDLDDPNEYEGFKLPKTTRWETRPGREGLWFRCNDNTSQVLAKHGFKEDQAQIKLFKDGQPIGEIKLQRTYQVIPPSWKKVDGHRTDYKMLDDVPPAEISLDWLLSELLKAGVTLSKKPNPTKKIQTDVKRVAPDKNKDHRYSEAALNDEVSILFKTSEGDRNNQLNKSSFALGQFVGADLLDERRAVEELTRAAHRYGLEPEEIERTIQSGLDEGKKYPREIPSQQDWKEAVKRAVTYMAKCCDGARTKDGMGFNKYDTEFCKGLADQINSRQLISNKELKEVHRKLQKYSKQLSSAGISLPPKTAECNTKESMATLIVKQIIESGAELWHSEDLKAFITFERERHKENHPLRSNNSRSWLARVGYEINGKAPAKQAVEDALNVLDGIAIFEGRENATYVRLAPFGDKVYVDLETQDWSAIEISAQGWQIISDPPVKFRRPKTLKTLPIPKRGGSWDDLRALCNLVDDRDWILTIAWLIQAFWPIGPYAHLVVTGEQGSGKSIVSRILKQLIDPSVIGLRRPPQCEKDLMIAAQEERIIAYDNLSGLKPELSDAFCALSTGGGLAGRKLYTDDEEAFVAAKRPVIMNGIDAIATRGDLLDRSIVIELHRMPEEKRIRERDLEKKIIQLQPLILGLVLDATVMGLRMEKEINFLNLPRMADFAAWVIACEPALPWTEGEFMEVYRQANEDAMIDLLESDTFADAVIKLVNEREEIELPPTNLWRVLNSTGGIDERHFPLGWPRSPKGIKNKLTRIAPALRNHGIGVEFSRSSKSRSIRIYLIDEFGDKPSDDHDNVMTTQNQPQVTTMTSVTTQSIFSLEKKKKRREKMEREDVYPKGKDRKISSSSSFSSLDSESGRHTDVTRSSQGLKSGIKAELCLAGERQDEWEEHFKTPEQRKVAGNIGKKSG